MRLRRSLCALALVAGCFNEDVRLYEVTLSGEVQVVGAMEGTLHLELHHARRGSGQLETPLGLIEATEQEVSGEVEWTALVPIDEGEGLVLYGWLDLDGDGLLCAVGAAPEPAGVVEIEGFPGHALSFALVLDAPCAGTSALYPPGT